MDVVPQPLNAVFWFPHPLFFSWLSFSRLVIDLSSGSLIWVDSAEGPIDGILHLSPFHFLASAFSHRLLFSAEAPHPSCVLAVFSVGARSVSATTVPTSWSDASRARLVCASGSVLCRLSVGFPTASLLCPVRLG